MSERPPLRPGVGGVELDLRVVPNAKRCQLEREDGAYKLRIDAPPVDGAANARVVEYVARELLRIPRSGVKVLRGERGRDKTLWIAVDAATLQAALDAALG